MGGKRSSEILHRRAGIEHPSKGKSTTYMGRRPVTEVVRNNGTPPCVTWASRRAREATESLTSTIQQAEEGGDTPSSLRTEATLLVPECPHISERSSAHGAHVPYDVPTPTR